MALRGASGEPAGRRLGQRVFGVAADLAPRERLLRGRAVELGVPLHARSVDAARVERGAQPGDARDHADLPGQHLDGRARGGRSLTAGGEHRTESSYRTPETRRH